MIEEVKPPLCPFCGRNTDMLTYDELQLELKQCRNSTLALHELIKRLRYERGLLSTVLRDLVEEKDTNKMFSYRMRAGAALAEITR